MHGDDGLHQELVERVDLLAETGQVRVVQVLVDLEAQAVPVQDLGGALLGHVLEGGSDLAGLLQRENLELVRVDDEFKLAALQNESVEEGAALFNESVLLVAQDLLLGDAGDEAARPSLVEHIVQDEELVIAARGFPSALLGVLARHGVLDDGADLLRVRHREQMRRLVSSLEGLLARDATLL